MHAMQARTVAVVYLIAAVASTSLQAQAPPYESASLHISPESQLRRGWKALGAEILESDDGTMGTLKLQNTSSQAVEEPRFYAEYFASSGQACFALLFEHSPSYEGRRGPFRPGEQRTLYAGAYWMSPALKVAEVRLHQVRGGHSAPVPYLPATMEGMSLTGERWEGVQVETKPGKKGGPWLDLVLARVAIDDRGGAQAPEVLYALDKGIATWFDEFMQHQQFLPAKRAGVAEASDVLILVRAPVSTRCLHERAFPPRESDIVRDYAAEFQGPRAPPLLTVGMVPRHIEPCAGCFDVLGIGAGFLKHNAKHQGEGRVPTAPGPLLKRSDPPFQDLLRRMNFPP
jgi:hypothetical protein